MIKTDGIILDIDGTLWNTTGVVAKAWNKAIADCGFDAAAALALACGFETAWEYRGAALVEYPLQEGRA